MLGIYYLFIYFYYLIVLWMDLGGSSDMASWLAGWLAGSWLFVLPLRPLDHALMVAGAAGAGETVSSVAA